MLVEGVLFEIFPKEQGLEQFRDITPKFGQFDRLTKLLYPKTNAFFIYIGVAGCNGLNISQILGPVGNGLHNDQIFGGGLMLSGAVRMLFLLALPIVGILPFHLDRVAAIPVL